MSVLLHKTALVNFLMATTVHKWGYFEPRLHTLTVLNAVFEVVFKQIWLGAFIAQGTEKL